jgi:hypothetical protein
MTMLGKKHSLETREKMRAAKIGKHLSPGTEFTHNQIPGRIEALPRGERHHNWKATPSYSALHAWVRKHFGRPMQCEDCGIVETKTRRMHWANISGNYSRDRSDWVRLCVLCHARRDKTAAKGWLTRKAVA